MYLHLLVLLCRLVYPVFVDFKQASDSISRNKIFEIMNYFGIFTKLVKLVSVTMEGAKACVQVMNDLVDHFEVNMELKQGDGLAPLLLL
jgi:Reverse transcriptase (RNA-dependent DNA polymerase).